MPVGSRVRANNVQGAVTDNPLVVGATTMNSAGLANLPVITAGTQHAVIVLDPLRTAGAPEIVIITAHTAADTSATVTRGAYGTTARQHASGVAWVHAATIDDLVQVLTSSTRPSDPYQGQLIYETDTDSYVGRGAGSVWQTVVPLGAWTSYTPTLTQSVAVTKTVTYAKYVRLGRIVHFMVDMTVTGTGTAGADVRMSLPFTAAVSNPTCGTGHIYDSSAVTIYNGVSFLVTNALCAIWPSADGGPSALGSRGFTAALAVNDLVRMSGTYEAAS